MAGSGKFEENKRSVEVADLSLLKCSSLKSMQNSRNVQSKCHDSFCFLTLTVICMHIQETNTEFSVLPIQAIVKSKIVDAQSH